MTNKDFAENCVYCTLQATLKAQEVKEIDRCGKKQTVKSIPKTPMTGKKVTRVLDTTFALDMRLKKIAKSAKYRGDQANGDTLGNREL